LVFLALVTACLAQRDCPTVNAGTGGTTPSPILAFYKYSFELPLSPTPELHLFMAMDDFSTRLTQTLWMRVSADSSTANSASLNPHVSLNIESLQTDPRWFTGDLISGDAEATKDPGPAGLNITSNGDVIYFDFYPGSCSLCHSSLDFSVEVGWITGSTTTNNWPDVLMIDNIRTIIFDEDEGGQVNFYATFSLNELLWTSVVYPGTIDQESQIVLYWQQGAAANTTHFADMYPTDGTIKGNYLVNRAFTATSAGIWYLSAYVKSAAATTPDFTVKFGFDNPPCAGASTLSASALLLALIPLSLLFSRQ